VFVKRYLFFVTLFLVHLYYVMVVLTSNLCYILTLEVWNKKGQKRLSVP
jgi:hypothetical protein